MSLAVRTSARLIDEQVKREGRRWKCGMVTLTYRNDEEWGPRDVAEFLKRVRHWMARRGAAFQYVWVLELTKRGRPHYHCLVWLPQGVTLPKPDKQGWWRKGMTRVEWARSPVGYLAKYASKTEAEARFPPGARLYGAGGLATEEAQYRRWVMLPTWIREKVEASADVRAAKGGGFVSRSTGEWWESPWRFRIDPGGRFYVWRIVEPPPATDRQGEAQGDCQGARIDN